MHWGDLESLVGCSDLHTPVRTEVRPRHFWAFLSWITCMAILRIKERHCCMGHGGRNIQTWFKRKPFFHQLDGGTKNQRLPLLHGIMMETFQTWLKRKPFLLIDDGFQHPWPWVPQTLGKPGLLIHSLFDLSCAPAQAQRKQHTQDSMEGFGTGWWYLAFVLSSERSELLGAIEHILNFGVWKVHSLKLDCFWRFRKRLFSNQSTNEIPLWDQILFPAWPDPLRHLRIYDKLNQRAMFPCMGNAPAPQPNAMRIQHPKSLGAFPGEQLKLTLKQDRVPWLF